MQPHDTFILHAHKQLETRNVVHAATIDMADYWLHDYNYIPVKSEKDEEIYMYPFISSQLMVTLLSGSAAKVDI